jgi:hypothetical protein
LITHARAKSHRPKDAVAVKVLQMAFGDAEQARRFLPGDQQWRLAFRHSDSLLTAPGGFRYGQSVIN